MRRDRSPKRARRFGLWLGLVALAIQGLFPFLLAAEVRAASFAGDDPAAVFCQIDDGTAQPGVGHEPGHAPGHIHCPICLGLQAGGAFLLPDTAGFMPPLRLGESIRPIRAATLAAAEYSLAYRSRAPPFSRVIG